METRLVDESKPPLGLKIAAGYFVFTGITGLILPILSFGSIHSDFESLSVASKVGSYSRIIMINTIFIISGIGLFKRRSWARKLGLGVLVISTLYGINEFAWGLAKGKPSFTAFTISTGILGAWNAIWFYLVFKKSSKDVLIKDEKRILTQEEKTDDGIIASYAQRVINLIADTIFYFILCFILTFLISLKGYQSSLEGFHGYLFGMLCAILYYFPQEALTGRTIGKLISGTEVINEDGSKISVSAAFGRTICRLIPFDAISYIPNSNKRVGWHDKLPRTRVISIR